MFWVLASHISSASRLIERGRKWYLQKWYITRKHLQTWVFNTLKSVKVFCLYLLKALILMLLWRWAFDQLCQWRAHQLLSRDFQQASRSDTVAPILARQMNGSPRSPSDMQMVSGVNWGKENHTSFVTRQVFYHVLFIHHFMLMDI